MSEENQCEPNSDCDNNQSSSDDYAPLELQEIRQDNGAKTFVYRDPNKKPKKLLDKIKDILFGE